MLPRRQGSPGTRGGSSQAAMGQVRVRSCFLGALAALFLVYMYFNVRFFAMSALSSNGIDLEDELKAAATKDPAKTLPKGVVRHVLDPNNPHQLPPSLEALAFHDEVRQVKHVAFTSACRPLDFVHGEVLAFTLRRTGYDGGVTHLLYGCSEEDALELSRKKNPAYGVETRQFPTISSQPSTFGEKLLTTTVNPEVVQAWLAKDDLGLLPDDFVMIVDSDAIFAKRIDMFHIAEEAKDVPDATIFGQDASWYWPNRFPLSQSELAAVTPSKSSAHNVVDWRQFAAIAPFVAEVSTFQKLLPEVVAFWSKLSLEKKYLAFPIAAAHHRTWIGISGVLSVHHYTSRYQNWDFVDDVKNNPCVERAAGRNLALWSYPITLRAMNFTLPQWIDGRNWSFFDDQVPTDFLTCDAWLFQQPSGHLWDIATHTNGYEHVPNILRRRHTMSVCRALEAYNSAAIDYKSHFCPAGFNRNRKMPMEFEKPAWRSAVALSPDTEMQEDQAVFFGEYKRKQVVASPAPQPGQAGSDDLHFVFSTSCEPYQNWQSQLLAESFARVQQHGRLTRIVSGCTDEQLQDLLIRQRTTPHMELHVTKNYAIQPSPEAAPKDDYAPYNKPFGLRDWLRTANPPVKESAVVIIDPDFLFLKPFIVNSGTRIATAKGVDTKKYDVHGEVVEGLRQYKRFFVYEGSRDLEQVTDHFKDGVALAQRWSQYLGAAGFEDPKSVAAVCPECSGVTQEDAREYYAVGPPYVLTRHDLELMIDDYCNMTVVERGARPDVWMAEMLGYSIAAAKHRIKHTIFDNLALGGKADDYYGFVNLIKGNPCDDSTDAPLVSGEAPSLFHGCHSYRATDDRGLDWIYYKQYMPNDLFACDSWLLAVPPASVWTEAKKSKDAEKIQQAYGLCTSIKLVNQALVDYKTKACSNGFNDNRRLRLVEPPRPTDKLQVGRVDPIWQKAAQAHVPLDA